MKENEMDLYEDWIKESKSSGRRLYLWNYLCFPTERGLIQGFNVFPGFSIHPLSEQVKKYVQDGIRGIFLCGIGEQLDFYATMKLYDDSSIDIDRLVDEFFSLYFGKASKPMHDFYNKIEAVYTNPANYPIEVQTCEAQFHQTEEIAWKYLGTDSVMSELEGYMDEALGLADTPEVRARVQSWYDGVWQYMKEGKEKYMKSNAQK